MARVAARPFTGTFRADPTHSSVAFALHHSGVYRYRGSLSDVTATLRGDEALEGTARVASISIVEPAAFREHVLGPEFFDAGEHPEIGFRSTELRFDSDGRAEVDGELTLRGVTRPIAAFGSYEAPRPDVYGGAVAGLSLRAVFDRREFGFDWQMAMPDGSDGLGWDVELEIDLRLSAVADDTQEGS